MELKRCPLRPLLDHSQWFRELFETWYWREKGYLADPGTWKDQAAKVPQLMSILDRAMGDATEDKRDRDTARQKRQSKVKSGGKAAAQKRPRPGAVR